MAVTRKSRTIIMTAQDDAVTGRFLVSSIVFNVAGGTAGQRLTLVETDGTLIADHIVEAANENPELVFSERWVDGIKVSAMPATGTVKQVVVRYR
jgi:hypothetical protein